jgi:hypothetical protein
LVGAAFVAAAPAPYPYWVASVVPGSGTYTDAV